MSAVEEYRKWCAKHYRESVGFDLADPAIAELEAKNKSQVEKTIEARQETHLAIIQKRQAEAELADLTDKSHKWGTMMHELMEEKESAEAERAERDRMLRVARERDFTHLGDYETWFNDVKLTARAELAGFGKP